MKAVVNFWLLVLLVLSTSALHAQCDCGCATTGICRCADCPDGVRTLVQVDRSCPCTRPPDFVDANGWCKWMGVYYHCSAEHKWDARWDNEQKEFRYAAGDGWGVPVTPPWQVQVAEPVPTPMAVRTLYYPIRTFQPASPGAGRRCGPGG